MGDQIDPTPLSSRIVLPSDDDFDTLRASFNGTIDRRPARIVVCSSVDDVREALADARRDGLPVAVRGGGHSVAGHSVGDGAVVLDLRGMKAIVVDPVARTASADGGVLWEEFDPACLAHGLATTGGTFGDTGIAGLTLGGGLGFLQGGFGLTCDNLIGAQLVTATGETLEVNERDHEDLFWALRGGGGNFGVVTRFDYRLHPIGTLLGGRLVYDGARVGEVLRVFRDLLSEAPDALTIQAVVRREGVVAVFPCWNGPVEDGERYLSPLRAIDRVEDAVAPITYDQMQRVFAKMPFGMRHWWKGHFVTDFADGLIDGLVQVCAESAQSDSAVLIEGFSGAPRRVPQDATAFDHRDAVANVSALAMWEDPARDADEIRWARSTADLAEPYSASGGGYVNYMQHDEPIDRVRKAYGEEKFKRLQQVKAMFDPENVFRFNHNIPPL